MHFRFKSAEYIRSARLLGSDETSARVEGVNHWEWVFQNEQVCLHVIRPSRGQKVIEEVMAGHSPEIWVSDLYSSQKANPAQDWQVCLARLCCIKMAVVSSFHLRTHKLLFSFCHRTLKLTGLAICIIRLRAAHWINSSTA